MEASYSPLPKVDESCDFVPRIGEIPETKETPNTQKTPEEHLQLSSRCVQHH